MARRIYKLVAVLLVVATCVVMGVSLGATFTPKEVNMVPFEPDRRPDGDALTGIVIPAEDDVQGNIELTAELYRIACENYKNSENAAFMVKSNTLMFDSINVEGHRYCLKNGDKRYYLEYSFVGDSGFMGVIVGIFDTKYVKAAYTDSTMDYNLVKMASAKSSQKNAPTYTFDEENGTYSYDGNWDVLPVSYSHEEKPVYAAYQDGNFKHTDHEVTADTITSAKVTYNAEEGYYTCEFTLDVNKVPENLLDSLRTSAGASDAVYTELKQYMEIWDNGYFRYYRALDSWSGHHNSLGMELTSVLDFATTYYYDDYWFDINNYTPEMAANCNAVED